MSLNMSITGSLLCTTASVPGALAPDDCSTCWTNPAWAAGAGAASLCISPRCCRQVLEPGEKNIRTGARVYEMCVTAARVFATRFTRARVTEACLTAACFTEACFTAASVTAARVTAARVTACSPCLLAVAACTPPPWRGTAQAAPSCTPRPSPPLTTVSVSESVHSVTGKCLRCHNKHMSLVTAHYSPSDIQMSPVSSLSSIRPDQPVTSQSSWAYVMSIKTLALDMSSKVDCSHVSSD